MSETASCNTVFNCLEKLLLQGLPLYLPFSACLLRQNFNIIVRMLRTWLCRAVAGASPHTGPGSRAVQEAVDPLVHQGPKFAIVGCGNMQYKVSVGDVIAVQRLRVDIGSRITLKKVHMVGGERFTAIGRPLLSGVRVVADVEEQKRMRPIISLFAPPSHRRSRLVEAAHAATILRIREIDFSPIVEGEIDKYEGTLCDPSTFNPSESPNKTYWADEVKSKDHGSSY